MVNTKLVELMHLLELQHLMNENGVEIVEMGYFVHLNLKALIKMEVNMKKVKMEENILYVSL